METLDEAKQFLRDNWEKGVECPCCGKFTKLYKYKILGETSAALIRLYRLPEGWHHVREFADTGDGLRRASRWPELRFWDLVELKTEVQPSTKHASGFWRITDKGKAFVEGKLSVQETMLFYNKKPRGFDGKYITIHDTFKNKFDYAELMGWK